MKLQIEPIGERERERERERDEWFQIVKFKTNNTKTFYLQYNWMFLSGAVTQDWNAVFASFLPGVSCRFTDDDNLSEQVITW